MGSDSASSHLFLAGLWAASTHKNKEPITKEVTETHQIAREAFWNAQTILTSFQTLQKSPCAPREISWHLEGEGDAVLNVDGSCVTNPGRARFGGVLRSPFGAWILGFFGAFRDVEILLAELLALKYSLTAA